VDQILKYLENSTGRDKFGKTLQYASRLLMWAFLQNDPKNDLGLRFKGLFEATRDARKLTRYFKTLGELNQLQAFLIKGTNDNLQLVLTIAQKLGMANYWFWDNLMYLKKAKFLKSEVDFNYYANLGWTVGLLFSILMALKNIKENLDQEANYIRNPDSVKGDYNKQLASVRAARTKLILNLVANLGDLTVCSNAIQLPQKIFGRGLNDGVMGVGGLLSALITGYYQWYLVNPA